MGRLSFGMGDPFLVSTSVARKVCSMLKGFNSAPCLNCGVEVPATAAYTVAMLCPPCEVKERKLNVAIRASR